MACGVILGYPGFIPIYIFTVLSGVFTFAVGTWFAHKGHFRIEHLTHRLAGRYQDIFDSLVLTVKDKPFEVRMFGLILTWVDDFIAANEL